MASVSTVVAQIVRSSSTDSRCTLARTRPLSRCSVTIRTRLARSWRAASVDPRRAARSVAVSGSTRTSESWLKPADEDIGKAEFEKIVAAAGRECCGTA